MAKRVLLSLFFSLLITGLVAQPASSIREQVEDEIRMFHLTKAQLSALRIPDPAMQGYYQTRILFLKFIASDNDDFLSPLFKISKVALNHAARMKDDEPLKNVYLAEICFMRGIARVMRRQIVKATLELSTCCTYLDANRHRFPDNIEQKKLLGIFNVALGAIPKKFQWLTGIFCFRGDTETGIQYLNAAAEKSILLADEAKIVLFYLEKNVLSQPDSAEKRISSLLTDNPRSFPFRYLQVSGLMELRRTDRALEVMQTLDPFFRKDENLFYSPYWDYTRAKAHYFRLEFTEAEKYFDKFLKSYKGKTLLADACFRKGMALALQGKEEAARKVFSELVDNESSGFDEDDYAWHTANRFRQTPPTAAELALFKARNLFDGGFYARAEAEILRIEQQLTALSGDEKTELFYRKGRILHASGNETGAKAAYRKCIAQQPQSGLWMKVYSHYYLGRILLEEGNKPEARSLFEQALEFDDYFYQSGLENRCKAALREAGA